MSSHRSQQSTAGFTLFETLIAMALMGFILAALATIAAQWLPNWDRGFTRVQRNELLALGLDRVVADLAAAEFIPYSYAESNPLFEGADRSVIFVRSAIAPNAAPGLEIVRIAEIDSEGGPAMVRMQAPFAVVGDGVSDRKEPRFADPVVLIRLPYRLTISYAGADRVWRDSWRNADRLPRAVKLVVRDTVTRRALVVATATVIHVELPARCISARSVADCLESGPRRSNGSDGSNTMSQVR